MLSSVSRRFAIASVLAGACASLPARAQADDLLRAGTDRAFAHLGVGTSTALGNSLPWFFQAEQVVGVHFRHLPRGPAIAGVLAESINAYYFEGSLSARFQWDFQPIGDRAFFIAPFLQAGGLLSYNLDPAVTGNHFRLAVELGLDLKLVFADAGYVFVRPIGIPVRVINTNSIGYEALVGGGVTF